ncbi:MAG: hypothetical protein ACYC9Z_01955 [Casimicrobiaceae bacterium]
MWSSKRLCAAAAAAVAHTRARIGDAQDAWDHGILSHVNAAASALGFAPGDRVAVALAKRVTRSGDPVVPEEAGYLAEAPPGGVHAPL